MQKCNSIGRNRLRKSRARTIWQQWLRYNRYCGRGLNGGELAQVKAPHHRQLRGSTTPRVSSSSTPLNSFTPSRSLSLFYSLGNVLPPSLPIYFSFTRSLSFSSLYSLSHTLYLFPEVSSCMSDSLSPSLFLPLSTLSLLLALAELLLCPYFILHPFLSLPLVLSCSLRHMAFSYYTLTHSPHSYPHRESRAHSDGRLSRSLKPFYTLAHLHEHIQYLYRGRSSCGRI